VVPRRPPGVDQRRIPAVSAFHLGRAEKSHKPLFSSRFCEALSGGFYSRRSLLILGKNSQVNEMMPMGLGAGLARVRAEPGAQLAEAALREHARAEAREVEARIRKELEYLPVKPSAARRLVRWGGKWLGGRDLRAPRDAMVQPMVCEAAAEVDRGRKDGLTGTLAAVPAMRERGRPQGATLPISAVPVFALQYRR